ncbi:MAG TPA: hypothetical protein VHQ65_14545 [Thermoanaerobaculia bacterium]|nr:hypothetical protein [Thermoanaerobaculia bacterium]
MSTRRPQSVPTFLALALGLALTLVAPAALAQGCTTQGSPTTGMALPPPCPYLSPNDVHAVEDPVQQAAILARPIHQFFVCHRSPGSTGNDCRKPGGTLGGDVEEFSSEVVLELTGTGTLSGYQRTITIPNVAVEVHTSKQTPGATQQSLATDMVRIQGTLPAGDPDFARFEIVGGTFNGQPSPGHTVGTFTGRDWKVDSQFEVGYTIEFVGAPGGKLAGYKGVTSKVTRMRAGEPQPSSGQ